VGCKACKVLRTTVTNLDFTNRTLFALKKILLYTCVLYKRKNKSITPCCSQVTKKIFKKDSECCCGTGILNAFYIVTVSVHVTSQTFRFNSVKRRMEP